jgi:hypothetical protein
MVMMKTTFTAVATPHALVLPVSHGLLFRQPPSFAAALMPPFPFIASPLSSSITIVIGAHRQEPRSEPRSEPPANASMQTSRNLSNAALTIGSAAVSHTRRHARQGFVPWLRANARPTDKLLGLNLHGLNLAIPSAVCSGFRCSGVRSLTGLRCQPLGAKL